MKMTINEILECLNKVIDEFRRGSSIEAKGHLVAVTSINKKFGNNKECIIRVEYVNLDTKKNTTIFKVQITDKCLSGEEDKLIKKASEKMLMSIFDSLIGTNCMEDIIDGLLGNK